MALPIYAPAISGSTTVPHFTTVDSAKDKEELMATTRSMPTHSLMISLIVPPGLSLVIGH